MNTAVRPAFYAAQVTALADEKLYSAAYQNATASRRAKTDRYRFPEDRYRSLGAEMLLRHALGEQGILMPSDLSRSADGKPYIENCPAFFSIAHSGEYAVCAVAPWNIGCDVEKVSGADMRVAKRFFTEREYMNILSCADEEERRREFFRVWTRKESLAKAVGLGMKLPFDSFDVWEGDTVAVGGVSYTFAEYVDLPGYRCAMCAEGDIRGAELKIVDLRGII